MDAAKRIARQLGALADDVSLRIIGLLARHRQPVPIRVVADELHISRSVAASRLRRLFDVSLISRASKRGSYCLEDSQELHAVIGPQSYTRITQELNSQNEDTPGVLNDN